MSIVILYVTFSLFIISNCAILPDVVDPIKEDADYWLKVNQQEIQDSLKEKIEIKNKAKNVILFLGDGMGVSTVTAARIFKAQRAVPRVAFGEETYLTFERFPNLALVKTYNTDRTTPDSAATATAYLTGVKGNMGTIGVDNNVLYGNCSSYNSSFDTTSVWKDALKAGKSVGIVTTARITHATPAGTYASTPDRDWESDTERNKMVKDELLQKHCPDIALQMIERGFEFQVLLGGGRSMFLPSKESDPIIETKKGKRSDERNLIQEWLEKHQRLNHKAARVFSRSQLFNISLDKVDYLLGLFSPNHLSYDEERIKDKVDEPTLEEMTEVAIKMLSKNPKGFVLLVEGGRIDHGHHSSKARFALSETVTFDSAISKAKEMTSAKDTLIMVTADHSHVFTMGGYTARGKDVLAGAGEASLPYGDLADDNLPFLSINYANGPGGEVNKTRKNLTGVDTSALHFVFPSLVKLSSETHGGEEVAVYAQGPWAHLFHRVHEQTHVATVARFAACLPPYDGDKCSISSTTISFGFVTLFLFSLLIHCLFLNGL